MAQHIRLVAMSHRVWHYQCFSLCYILQEKKQSMSKISFLPHCGWHDVHIAEASRRNCSVARRLSLQWLALGLIIAELVLGELEEKLLIVILLHLCKCLQSNAYTRCLLQFQCVCVCVWCCEFTKLLISLTWQHFLLKQWLTVHFIYLSLCLTSLVFTFSAKWCVIVCFSSDFSLYL